MSEIGINRIWTLPAKELANELTREELLELKKLESRYPAISCRVQLIMKWWYLDKIIEQKFTEGFFIRIRHKERNKTLIKSSLASKKHLQNVTTQKSGLC